VAADETGFSISADPIIWHFSMSIQSLAAEQSTRRDAGYRALTLVHH